MSVGECGRVMATRPLGSGAQHGAAASQFKAGEEGRVRSSSAREYTSLCCSPCSRALIAIWQAVLKHQQEGLRVTDVSEHVAATRELPHSGYISP